MPRVNSRSWPNAEGDSDAAAALWHQLARDPADGLGACEQLAIHYERKARDYQKALQFAQLPSPIYSASALPRAILTPCSAPDIWRKN